MSTTYDRSGDRQRGVTADAALVADHLVEAGLMGHDTHSVLRLPQYVNMARDGTVELGAELEVLDESDYGARLSGGWNYGPVTATRAVELALEGHNAQMPAIKRVSDNPYRWEIEAAPLAEVANREKFMPRDYIREDGFGISDAGRAYLAPLIQGEDFPPFENGLPKMARLKLARVEKRLPEFSL